MVSFATTVEVVVVAAAVLVGQIAAVASFGEER